MNTQRGITPHLAATLDCLNAAIAATPPDERDTFDGCMSPFYAADISNTAAAKARRAAARTRHNQRLAAGLTKPGTILRDRLAAAGERGGRGA